MRKTAYLLPIAAVAVVTFFSSIYVVDEREKALVMQFGQIVSVQADPGIGFKIPFIQEVVKYSDLILSLDTDAIEVTPSDDRRLVVDAFARYRISDVVLFRQAVGSGGLATAQDRLQSILNAQIREVLGADQVTSDTILSSDRRALMNRIRDQSQASAQGLGLDIIDVRLKQTNLPSQNLDATFARMRAEREREVRTRLRAATRRHSAYGPWPTGPWSKPCPRRNAKRRSRAVKLMPRPAPSLPRLTVRTRSFSTSTARCRLTRRLCWAAIRPW